MTAPRARTAQGLACAGGLALAWLASSSLAQSGGGYELRAQVVAAGQANGLGDAGLSMVATVAQTDAAGAANGASYSLVGGFWPVATNPPPADALFGNGFE